MWVAAYRSTSKLLEPRARCQGVAKEMMLAPAEVVSADFCAQFSVWTPSSLNARPLPHFSRLRGYLCVLSITGHPHLEENWRTFYRLFHIISTPLLGNFSHLTPYLGNMIMVTLIPFLLFYILFFRLWKYVYIFNHYPGGGLLQKCNIIRALPPFLGMLFKAQETWMYRSYPLFLNFSGSFCKISHITGNWFKNTPFSGFSQEHLPETNGPKHIPFLKKVGIRLLPPCTFEWGGGDWKQVEMPFKSVDSFLIVLGVNKPIPATCCIPICVLR